MTKGRSKTTMHDLHDQADWGNSRNNCWLWTGAKTSTGYGQVSFGGKKVRTHRLMMHFKYNFNLASKRWIRHKCNTKLCINPSHLYETKGWK